MQEVTLDIATVVQSEYLYDLLQRIKERPGMYLGKRSITRLRMLLAGYSLARQELKLPLTEQEKKLAAFKSGYKKDSKLPHLTDGIVSFFSIRRMREMP